MLHYLKSTAEGPSYVKLNAQKQFIDRSCILSFRMQSK